MVFLKSFGQVDFSQQLRARFGYSSDQGVFNEKIFSFLDLQRFYIDRDFHPVWDLKSSTDLIDYINDIGAQGLEPKDYHLIALLDLQRMGGIQKADFEILLSDAFVILASHLISGKVNPQTIDSEWKTIRREGKPFDVLKRILEGARVKDVLDQLAPDFKTYDKLKSRLADLRLTSDRVWLTLPSGETLKPGLSDSRIVLLRNRLIESQDLDTTAFSTSELYDSMLFHGVKKFQRRHGLIPDGNVGKNTVAELNISKNERIDQLIVNLERCRWLPETLGNHYIMVNIPAFELEVVKKGKVEMEIVTAVGKPYRKTPVFSQKLSYIVFNPYWTIPPTILAKDMLPAQAKNPNHFKNLNIKVLNQSGSEVDASTINWVAMEGQQFPYMLRQEPGANNALGAVKFIFPNIFNVYMHDTNHREVFIKEERALSSGCIRLEKPLELAEYLLVNNGKLTKIQFDDIVKNKKDYSVILGEEVMVHIQYWTSFVDETGALNFRKDVYQRDKPVLIALKSNAPSI